jgi:hypothetical protein
MRLPLCTRRQQPRDKAKKRPKHASKKKVLATKNTRVFGKTQNLTPPTHHETGIHTQPISPNTPKNTRKTPEKKHDKNTHAMHKKKWKTIHTKQRAQNLLTPQEKT